jgi:hypothetical protein
VGASDRAPSGAGADRFSPVVAALVLLAGAALLAAVCVYFVAVAVGSGYSPFDGLALSSSHLQRALVFGVAFLIFLLLVLVGVRRGDPVLFLECGMTGCLVVRASAVEGFVRTALAAHPDVLRSKAEVRLDDQRLRAEVEIAARPLTDAAALAATARRVVADTLHRSTGISPEEPRVRVRVVPVRGLRRYL